MADDNGSLPDTTVMHRSARAGTRHLRQRQAALAASERAIQLIGDLPAPDRAAYVRMIIQGVSDETPLGDYCDELL